MNGTALNHRAARQWTPNNAWHELEWSFLAVLLECNPTPLIAMDETFEVFTVMCFTILSRVSDPRAPSAKRAL